MRALRIRVSNLESQLKASMDRNHEKDKKIIVLGMDRDEAVAQEQLQRREVERLKSTEHTAKIIADLKKSQDYEVEVEARMLPFLDKGIVHAIRQLHPLIEDKKSLVGSYENSFHAEACKKGADFVPFQEDKLAALQATDQELGLPEWVLPLVLHPSFWELLEA